jgi:hypothetical protein
MTPAEGLVLEDPLGKSRWDASAWTGHDLSY